MDNWKIWNKGADLTEAHIRFGEKDMVASYDRYRIKTTIFSVIEKMEENANRGLEGLDLLKDVVDSDSERRKKADELKKNLKYAFLRNVRKGVLIGYGLSVPRRAEDEPQIVPGDLWDNYLYSSGDILKSDSLKMEKVRVVYEGWLNDNKSEEPKLAGRPTRQDHIVEAFETLLDLDLIDLSKPATACHDLVRQWVMKNYPNEENSDKGLGAKAIAKHINPLFKQYKADWL